MLLNMLNFFINITRNFSKSASSHMKYMQFTYKDKPCDLRVGCLNGCYVIDVNKLDYSIPSNMMSFMQYENCFRNILQCYQDKVAACQVDLKDICLRAPIHGMDKILCVALNYTDHCHMHNLKPPPVPVTFSKFSSTIVGPDDPVLIRTSVTKKVDYEVELCVVIGSQATCVPSYAAYNYVFGFTICQDITARDWTKEKNGGQFLLGKSMDTFCPIGPWIVTPDEMYDLDRLDIRCWLNGVCKQTSNTANLIHKIPDIISRLSSVMTLYPGDLILTGTPGGVGAYDDPPVFLKPGDILCSEIENIGFLLTRIGKLN